MFVDLEQAQDEVAVRPDVPSAQTRRAIPRAQWRRLLASEAAIGRVRAQITFRRLNADQEVRDTQHVLTQSIVTAAMCGSRRRVQPFARVLAIPIAFVVLLAMLGMEQSNRGALLVHDEVAQSARQIGRQRFPEDAAERDVRRVCELHERVWHVSQPASTTQRKPSMPARSFDGAISRYLPC